MRLWVFDSTHDAYDACQTNDLIQNGDTLVIRSESVVGLAWTWPVAVTVATGDLHAPVIDGSLFHLKKDAKWTNDQIKAAVRIATEHGWPINPFFTAKH